MLVSRVLILALSFIPMVLYAVMLWWLDRYEKEPLALLVTAFVWGALPSIVLALLLQMALDVPLMRLQTSSQLTYDLVGASIVAPLTEEGVKAIALLALLLLLRHEIDSPLDGVIYGGIVGFGFAAVENVFYLLGAYDAGGMGNILGLAFLRAGVFGLNHAMYTGFTGLGVGLALEVREKALQPLLVLAGWGAAVSIHALHNALATLSSYGTWTSLFIAIITDWIGVLVLLSVAVFTFWLERQRIAAYGRTLVQAQVIPEAELATLTSVFGRRQAGIAVLLEGDIRRWRTLRRYQQKVTEAAFTWHRLHHGDAAVKPRLVRLEEEAQRLRSALALGGAQEVNSHAG